MPSARPAPRLGQFWTAANMLSLARLVLVVPITYLTWIGGPLTWLFGLIGLGALTDWLDGRVARWSETVSGWGKVLDPLADKFAAAMVVSALTFRPVEPTLPAWLFALVLGRDACIVTGGLIMARRTGQVAMSAQVGKAAVAALALTCLAAVLAADPPVLWFCIWATTALLVVSFAVYLTRYLWVARTGEMPAEAETEPAPPTIERAPRGEKAPASSGAKSEREAESLR